MCPSVSARNPANKGLWLHGWDIWDSGTGWDTHQRVLDHHLDALILGLVVAAVKLGGLLR
jgi:hypothetical protein